MFPEVEAVVTKRAAAQSGATSSRVRQDAALRICCPCRKKVKSVKAPATITLVVMAMVMSVLAARAQTCTNALCAGGPGTNHNLFIERQYRDFLLQLYPNYGSRYRGMSPDISVGPGATVGGPLPGTVGRSRLRQRQKVQFDANAHLRWCQERYASYRLSDDTFQPFEGPRRRCNSPYN